MADIPQYRLNDDTYLPAIGLGTYSLNGDAGAESIATAIGLGYRLIDTAYSYGNEDAVGAGIRRSGIARDEVFVTSKVPNGHHGLDKTRRAFDTTLETLGLDRVDLYLIHWPEPEDGLYVDTWKALVEFREQGRARSIGVSNFHPDQLERIIGETGVTPSVNQIPVDLFGQHPEWREANAAHGILTESYSPLKHAAEWRSHPVVTGIAEAHGATPNQVVLRWHLQNGLLPIPRSRSAEHQRENLDVFGFELSDEELGRLAGLAR
ncbi:aldo/keto reductase [Gryllotalpicola ginsengisoli]|uniref:aldo/keto reductase n=1 Tax=Gryllotalpicola ginsengisoli TaxID=444608 RepID=UPI0003B5EAE0|nr:aldo/keto reductase [Gryllotalpicola ginsengisoli]